MERCLITGGAGFIGSHLVNEIVVNKKKQVVVLDNLSNGTTQIPRSLLDQVEFIQGDIRDIDLVAKIMKNVDYVFHLAAVSSVPKSFENSQLTNSVNIEGTLNLLNAAQKNKIKKFVFASTAAIYGERQEVLKTEEMLPDLHSPYAISKRCGELYCLMFYKKFGLNTTILRYFNVYGPRQRPDSEYSSVIPKFIYLLSRGLRPTIFGNGFQSRDFVYIDDIVMANWQASKGLNSPGHIYNIGTGTSHTILELTNFINQILKTDIKPTFSPTRSGDVNDSRANISKARQELNFEPTFDLESGLVQTIQDLVDT